ncbi:hypothetical protein KIN20_019856 [Parelaphostrongylus tenuis]|uniref:Uncharacterized protein n=1 Tax=Parelaphostrongylus tenuis TaxID=148309 RepID=A0AAD5QVA0_PARTN|nr:hypothetical protein KIN20_019856 [Parelaphostrongylus tenuis]
MKALGATERWHDDNFAQRRRCPSSDCRESDGATPLPINGGSQEICPYSTKIPADAETKAVCRRLLTQ